MIGHIEIARKPPAASDRIYTPARTKAQAWGSRSSRPLSRWGNREMASSKQDHPIARFGTYEADLRTFEIRKLGLRMRLQRQPFRILALLLRQRGRIVSREEIRNALWGGDTFVEFDHGINTAMQKIRGVLSDSASNPRFVETVPRRGYRFIAPVEFVGSQPSRRGPTRGVRGTSHTMARLAGLVERSLSYIKRGQT